jgi:hypothetical protein
MTPEDRAIRLIEEIERSPREVGPVLLSEEYSRAVEHIESHPSNRQGSDKSWVPRLLEESRNFYARAVRRR